MRDDEAQLIHQLRELAVRGFQVAVENNDRSLAQGIVSLNGVRQSGDRAGNWLTREQARDLLAQPDIETTEGKWDRAIPVLLGCALRRSELAALKLTHIQQRDGRWVFIDLDGQGKGDTDRAYPAVRQGCEPGRLRLEYRRALCFGECVVENIRRRPRKL